MKRKRRQKNILMAAVILCCLFFVSCALPVETIRPAKLVKDSDRVEVKTVPAEKSDITSLESLKVSAMPLRDETLHFGVPEKEEYEWLGIYCGTGDRVEEGQVMAELQSPDLDEKIREGEEELAGYQESLSMHLQHYEIEKRRMELQNAGMPWAERVKAREKAEEEEQAARAKITDSIEFSEARLSRLREEKENYVIRAPFSGTVLFVVNPGPEEKYKGGNGVFRLADLSFTLFEGKTLKKDQLTKDKIYTIDLDGVEAEVLLLSAEDPGYPAETEEDGAEDRVYFQLSRDLEFSYSKSYNVVYESEKAENVLSVPTSCVYRANDTAYVYMLNADGLRERRDVETGVSNAERTEIRAGLLPGEEVISE